MQYDDEGGAHEGGARGKGGATCSCRHATGWIQCGNTCWFDAVMMCLIMPLRTSVYIAKRLKSVGVQSLCYKDTCSRKEQLLAALNMRGYYGDKYFSYCFLFRFLHWLGSHSIGLRDDAKLAQPDETVPFYICLGSQCPTDGLMHCTAPILAIAVPPDRSTAEIMHSMILQECMGRERGEKLARTKRVWAETLRVPLKYENYQLTSCVVKYDAHVVALLRCKEGWFFYNNDVAKENKTMRELKLTRRGNANLDPDKTIDLLHRRVKNTYLILIYAQRMRKLYVT